ncbi:MAG TPA: thiamine pyrophosphate-dependent enzyme, partial [Acidimicrobiales bacterium]|nr:thiamine pyrophosphate-dependent enzyme [Acidimicrobiales bacterium]
ADPRLSRVSVPRTEWLEDWLAAEAAARSALDRLLDSWTAPFEGRVARDVFVALPAGATLVVGSSMPVRDLESFAPPRAGLQVVANRGASGIDGFPSTVLGVAAATAGTAFGHAAGTAFGLAAGGPVAALAGDLTVLHDLNGLLGTARRGLDATFVVLDNDGGGIFNFLPQAASPEHFERLFGTPHGTDLVAVVEALGVPAQRVETAGEVGPAVDDALERGGVRMVVVPTERAQNVERHGQAWAAVADALG